MVVVRLVTCLFVAVSFIVGMVMQGCDVCSGEDCGGVMPGRGNGSDDVDSEDDNDDAAPGRGNISDGANRGDDHEGVSPNGSTIEDPAPRPGPNPTPVPGPSPIPEPSVTYQVFFDKNAYSGWGAIDIDSDPASGLSEQLCKDRCTLDPACECVTQERSTGNCWKRRSCDRNGWNSMYNSGYNVYLKQASSSPTPSQTPTPAPINGPGGGMIKFLEWNVHYQNKNTDGMAHVLKQNNADVIGLDEFTADFGNLVRALNAQHPDRSYELMPGHYWAGYGTDIVFDSRKFKAIEGGRATVSCHGTCGGNRAATWVVLRELATNRLLITGGIHLSACNNHNCQACELRKFYENIERIKGKYPDSAVVYMGDLNRGPDGIQQWLQGQVDGKRVFAVEDVSQAAPPTCLWTDYTIDFILAEQGAGLTRIAGGRTGQGSKPNWLGGHAGGGGADHFPVYATLKWST